MKTVDFSETIAAYDAKLVDVIELRGRRSRKLLLV